MNEMPLPVHLLAKIPGYAMLGQTSYGGYFKIIHAWWLNDCPNVFTQTIEWCSLSGMYQRDYDRHKDKIEPLLLKSIDVLTKYRAEERDKKKHLSVNVKKAQAVRMSNLAKRQNQSNKPAAIVDKHTPVNPTLVKPNPQPFHEGWNLHKPGTFKKKPASTKAFLTDK